MTMIEKVAAAIQEAELGNNWEAMARAAIEAMREPTDAMTGAEGVGWARDGSAHIDRDPREYWPLMIDAALAEKS